MADESKYPPREERIEQVKWETKRLEKEFNELEKAWQHEKNKIEAAEKMDDAIKANALKPIEEKLHAKMTLSRLKLDEFRKNLEIAEESNKDLFDFTWHSWMMKKTADDRTKMIEVLFILFKHRKEVACRETIDLIKQYSLKSVDHERSMLRITEGSKILSRVAPHFLIGDRKLDPQQMQKLYEEGLFPLFDEMENCFDENKDLDDSTWKRKAKPVWEKIFVKK